MVSILETFVLSCPVLCVCKKMRLTHSLYCGLFSDLNMYSGLKQQNIKCLKGAFWLIHEFEDLLYYERGFYSSHGDNKHFLDSAIVCLNATSYTFAVACT